MALSPPVIILGNTRSGTSVLQNVLSEHPSLEGWYEPRNMWQFADPRREHDEFDASDATPRVRRYVRGRLLRHQRQHGDRTVVEKTPVNILRIPYVRAIVPEATWLFIVRSPFSFIHSVERKWQRPVTTHGVRRRLRSTPVSQLHVYAGQYARQHYEKRVLGRTYLSTWGPRYRGIHEDLRTEDLLTVIARQWAVCSQRAEQALAAFPAGAVLRLRYEDFVQDPVAHIGPVVAHCGLEMTDDVFAAARQIVDPDRRDKWRRFDPGVLARLLPELEGEMQRHGYAVPDEIAAAAGGEPRSWT